MRAIVRQCGEERWVDVDLEEEIRSGRIGPDVLLCYPPWTGERFVRVAEIPAAAAAMQAPAARLQLRFSRPVRTPLTWLAATFFLLAAAVQAGVFGGLRAPGGAWLDLLALSWEGSLLGGAWWTVWTAPFVHASPAHLVVNLLVLMYAGYRVERVAGSAPLFLVLVASMALSSAAVLGLAALPVIGSSALAYGVWGAQILIGLRLGDALPAQERRYYGWGNFIFFLPLWLAGIGAEGASTAAHLGGLVGGGVAALFTPSAVLAPAFRSLSVGRRVSATALGLALTVAGLTWGWGATPSLLRSERQPVEVAGAGVTLVLPTRFVLHPHHVGGLPAWSPRNDPRSGVFCGLVRGGAEVVPTKRAQVWGSLLEGEGSTVSDGDLVGNGWASATYTVEGERDTMRVVELDLRRGETALRCGYWHPVGWVSNGNYSSFYNSIIDTMVVRDPPALLHARQRWSEAPGSPSRRWDYATELRLLGAAAEADALLAALDARGDRWALDAARARLEIWEETPALGASVPSATISRWIEAAEASDVTLIKGSVDTLVEREDCALVREAIDAVRLRLSAERWREVESRLGVCRVQSGRPVRL